jgi:hypothetical protein
MQRRKLVTVAVTIILSVMPMAFSAPAYACDPDNPCDPPPMEIPWFCKLSPSC